MISGRNHKTLCSEDKLSIQERANCLEHRRLDSLGPSNVGIFPDDPSESVSLLEISQFLDSQLYSSSEDPQLFEVQSSLSPL